MTMIKIDKNVPLPGKGTKAETDIVKTTLEHMAEGNSFIVKNLGIKQATNRLRGAAEDIGIRIKIGKDEDGHVRCWKMSPRKNHENFEMVIKKKLKRGFAEAGLLNTCVNCGKVWDISFMGFAHKYNRKNIKQCDIVELRNVIRICNFPCHDALDNGTGHRKKLENGTMSKWTHESRKYKIKCL